MKMLSFQYYVVCVVVNVMIVWTVTANGFAPKPLLFAPMTTFLPSLSHRLPCATCTSSSAKSTSDLSSSSTVIPDTVCAERDEDSDNNEEEEVLVEVLEEEFVKPRLDGREYRSIRLTKNGLEVLLVSDDETDVESAAVHVKAGHFNDPIDRAGLAHFHEHMLFLGTAKYPSEDDYESFLASYGGSSNAYTDMEDTNYYFSLMDPPQDDDDDDKEENNNQNDRVSEGLAGALDRFAQFFIQPNFDVDMLEREMQAVDSEYKNSLTSDSWRMYQTLKHTANNDHPFSKFGCGNYQTLSDNSSPRDDLFQFWNTYYRGPNMKLCVVGRSSLDSLQQSVLDTFGNLPSSHQILKDNQLQTTDDSKDDSSDTTVKSPDQNGKEHAADDTLFQLEHAKYGGVVAFGKEQLGNIRETIPVVEKRSIQIYFATPPMDDPVMTQARPYRVLSHLLGHESPGTLHALLFEEGLINGLSSGIGVDTSDFSLCSLTLSMTPKGMKQKDYVLDIVWQYIALIKQTTMNNNNDHNIMEQYHDEMNKLSNMNFQWRENGDPTDFCSNVAELLFQYPPSQILVGTSITESYNDTVTQQFFDRFTPENCIVSIVQPKQDYNNIEDDSWETEPWYGAKFRQTPISQELQQKWLDPNQTIDPRLRLPELNDFIPTDFSLRSEDEKNKKKSHAVVDDEEEEDKYRDAPPKLIQDMEGLTMWHKMDRTFKVPKSYIRISITSPNVYRSPRSMTYGRLFQKVLEDDLNSFLYDATMAGCYCNVFCTPSGFRINFTGFSEKLPLLVDVVTNRITSILTEMKEEDPTSSSTSSSLSLKFDKAVENLVRETKNFRLDSPHETASYNTRMLLEDNVWHVENYISEMEGKYAEKNPLTLQECASVVEECLSERTLVQSLCMGNIDDDGALKVADIVDRQFLSKSRPLTPEEVPILRSVKMPTMKEAVKIFGKGVASSPIPVVLEDVVNNESEENHAVEVVLQAGAEHDLGYEGIAIAELIGHIAYNSAFNQLRTKEQLGYIVSAYTKKSAGSLNSFAVIVQSASTTPDVLEERILNWLDLFRKELEEITPERYAMEAGAIVAHLLERNQRLSDEVASRWGGILGTDPSGKKFKDPEFNRLEILADILTVDESEEEGVESECYDESVIKTSAQLKKKVLAFFDKHFTPDAPERRIMSSRVYGYSARPKYEANKEKVGVLSSYDEVRDFKRFLSVWPTAPYWI